MATTALKECKDAASLSSFLCRDLFFRTGRSIGWLKKTTTFLVLKR